MTTLTTQFTIPEFSIEFSTDYQSIINILSNPTLFKYTLGQDNRPINTISLDHNYKYILLKNIDNNESIGIFMLQEITKILVDIHIAILPKYWGRGLPQLIVKATEDYILKTTCYKTVMTSVPINCQHGLKFMESIKYIVCGKIDNGIIYNNKLVSLILYSKYLGD